MNKTGVSLTFAGGVEKVTGANFLLETVNTKVLVDCGLIQGYFEGNQDPNKEPFLYNPADIDFLVVTHAHIDHIGRIGKLVRDGFSGTIYSTHPTRELAQHMLEDAIKVMGYEAHGNTEDMLYERHDIDAAMAQWETIDYHQQQECGDFSIYLKDAGHILGSAIAEITHTESGKKIVFSGDLGNSPGPLLPDTEKITDADIIVMESVYGDRVHAERKDRKENIKQVITKVVQRGGTLIVPVFSLEKTQIFLKELNDLIEDKEVPSVPVFFDSPLGIKVTSVYAQSTEYFKQEVQDEIKAGDDIFDFPKLEVTMRQQDSRDIGKTAGAKIIIASSGMSEGGRITAHEKRYLPDKKNALLLIGYQVSGSVGRKLQDGNKRVRIDGEYINIKADVFTVSGYSSHADRDQLMDFVANTAEKVQKVYVCMGEPKSSLFLVQRLRDFLGVDAVMPELGEKMEL